MIQVFIVDDSAVVRQTVRQSLEQVPDIIVIGVASDPIFALQQMNQKWPDVILLDIEMPRMDGITFLKKIMQQRPTPVVICSTLAERGAQATMEALSAGAVTVITKPKVGLKDFLQDSADNLVDAIRAAASAVVSNIKPTEDKPLRGISSTQSVTPPQLVKTTDYLVAIGTSTGGTQALEGIIKALPATAPGMVIVQHMPEMFTAMFAQRLDGISAVRVKEAKHGDRVLVGQVLIAPGGRHMSVARSGAQYRVEVRDGPLVNRHKPSVDVLFRSVAQQAGANAMGFILTGMGNDGAKGLLAMRTAGAKTYVQDEATSVVFGMPKEALKIGAAKDTVALARVSQLIIGYDTNL